jgi:hypothetical protein
MCDIYRLPPEESASGSGFKIALRGSRSFIFAGTNPTIVEEWVNAILLAKSSQSGKPFNFNKRNGTYTERSCSRHSKTSRS